MLLLISLKRVNFGITKWFLMINLVTNLEQCDLLVFKVVSLNYCYTRLSDFLGEEYIDWDINYLLFLRMSRAEILRISVVCLKRF